MISPFADYGANTELRFDNFMLRGALKRLARQVSGQATDLLELNEVTAGRIIETRYALGLQIVWVKQIKGSLDKNRGFDADFYPTQYHLKDRWTKIAKAIYEGKNLPPVELIQIEDSYYVVDGHHRVSVARAMKQTYIDAVVTVWTLRPVETDCEWCCISC